MAVNPSDMWSVLEAVAHARENCTPEGPTKTMVAEIQPRASAVMGLGHPHTNKLKGDFISAKHKKANEPRSQKQSPWQVVVL